VATPGTRITEQKRLALADCTGLLERACGELEHLVRRGREQGLDIYEVEDVTPLAQRVVALRERRERLADELHAISSEWS
jgi:hypothetical protein